MRNHTGWLIGALLLAGCATEPADPNEAACDDFANFLYEDRPADRRDYYVTKIGEQLGEADQALRDAHEVMVNSLGAPNSQPIGDDMFAQACLDAGWEG